MIIDITICISLFICIIGFILVTYLYIKNNIIMRKYYKQYKQKKKEQEEKIKYYGIFKY